MIGNILSGDQAVAPGGPFGDDLAEGIKEPVDIGNTAAHADACPYCTAMMSIMTSQLVNERMDTERSSRTPMPYSPLSIAASLA